MSEDALVEAEAARDGIQALVNATRTNLLRERDSEAKDFER